MPYLFLDQSLRDINDTITKHIGDATAGDSLGLALKDIFPGHAAPFTSHGPITA